MGTAQRQPRIRRVLRWLAAAHPATRFRSDIPPGSPLSAQLERSQGVRTGEVNVRWLIGIAAAAVGLLVSTVVAVPSAGAAQEPMTATCSDTQKVRVFEAAQAARLLSPARRNLPDACSVRR